MLSFSDSVVCIGVGSNIGNRERNIAEAFFHLEKSFLSLETAPLYESKPLFFTDQPDFLNTVFCGIFPENKRLSPQQLLTLALETEELMGRTRDPLMPKGPRIIDIDILLYGNRVINTSELVIPHPGMKDRLFVLLPLLDICGNPADPLTSLKYDKISEGLPDQGVYLYQSCRYIEKYRKTG